MSNLYHIDPYAKNAKTEIISAFEDEGRFCVTVKDALFYPQGGGQKGDRGTIIVNGSSYIVADTIKDKYSSDNKALLILEQPTAELVKGQSAEIKIDWNFRYTQMRLHNLVHLHHCMMEKILGEKIENPSTSDLGHDSTAVNRYETPKVTEDLANQAVEETKAAVNSGAEVTTRDDPEKSGFRYWEALGYIIPCGGTHLKNISEIGDFKATVTKKKGKVKIDFSLL